jgi:hypothetical protein
VVEIVAVEMPRDWKRFVSVVFPIYADDPHWVPPLLIERKAFFNPSKNPYFKHATIKFFVAVKDGRDVGSIAATVDHKLREHEPTKGLIGFFEFIDDRAVSKALFDAAATWFRTQGVTAVEGPYNFNSNHEFGLVVDGFDTDPCISNPHNRAWYGAHYEAIGLAKAMDWYAYWLDKGPMPERIKAISDRFLQRNPEVTLRKCDMSKWDSEKDLFFQIYNDAWENNWGHIHFDKDEFEFVAAGLKQIINPDLAWFAYVGDDIAGATLTLPDFNQVVKKTGGSLFPLGWWHLLFGAKKIDALRIFVLGIRQKYQHLPLGAPLYVKTWEEGYKLPIRGAEASLILETNVRMRGAMEKMGGRIYKTYRTYLITL